MSFLASQIMPFTGFGSTSGTSMSRLHWLELHGATTCVIRPANEDLLAAQGGSRALESQASKSSYMQASMVDALQTIKDGDGTFSIEAWEKVREGGYAPAIPAVRLTDPTQGTINERWQAARRNVRAGIFELSEGNITRRILEEGFEDVVVRGRLETRGLTFASQVGFLRMLERFGSWEACRVSRNIALQDKSHLRRQEKPAKLPKPNYNKTNPWESVAQIVEKRILELAAGAIEAEELTTLTLAEQVGLMRLLERYGNIKDVWDGLNTDLGRLCCGHRHSSLVMQMANLLEAYPDLGKVLPDLISDAPNYEGGKHGHVHALYFSFLQKRRDSSLVVEYEERFADLESASGSKMCHVSMDHFIPKGAHGGPEGHEVKHKLFEGAGSPGSVRRHEPGTERQQTIQAANYGKWLRVHPEARFHYDLLDFVNPKFLNSLKEGVPVEVQDRVIINVYLPGSYEQPFLSASLLDLDPKEFCKTYRQRLSFLGGSKTLAKGLKEEAVRLRSMVKEDPSQAYYQDQGLGDFFTGWVGLLERVCAPELMASVLPVWESFIQQWSQIESNESARNRRLNTLLNDLLLQMRSFLVSRGRKAFLNAFLMAQEIINESKPIDSLNPDNADEVLYGVFHEFV